MSHEAALFEMMYSVLYLLPNQFGYSVAMLIWNAYCFPPSYFHFQQDLSCFEGGCPSTGALPTRAHSNARVLALAVGCEGFRLRLLQICAAEPQSSQQQQLTAYKDLEVSH